MYSLKLVQTLIDPLNPEWENLIQTALGNDLHPDRKNGFFLSREALKSALSDFGEKIKIADLKLVGFSRVSGLDDYTISLSHTKNCGAALVAQRKKFRSVGIDIEDEGRMMKDTIRHRIIHANDMNLRNIELWCVKEAAFKAIMNTELFEKPIEFSSIEISEGKWRHSPSHLAGTWELQNPKPFLLALAFLEN